MKDLNFYIILNYTLTATVTAAVILLVKSLFKKKLSVNWHFYIWTLLIIRLMLPSSLTLQENSLSVFNLVNTSRISAAVQQRVEDFKGVIRQKQITAQGSKSIESAAVPYLQEATRSARKDVLLYIYFAGVLLSGIYFSVVFISIRIKLWKSPRASEEIQQLLKDVRIKAGVTTTIYSVISDTCTSPAICGIFNPVLVIPSDMKDNIDERIIVHEVMHYKHGDILLNLIITVLRCLNWFNPVMWLLLNRIQKDCEVLCDKRVLDYYSSDERENYGNVLLEISAKDPGFLAGTTCISNGKANVKERIEFIAAYRKGYRYFRIVALFCSLFIVLTTFTMAKSDDYHRFISEKKYYGDYSEFVKDTNRLNSIKLSSPLEALVNYGMGALGNIRAYYMVAKDEERQYLIDKSSEINIYNLNEYMNVLPTEYLMKPVFGIYNFYTMNDGVSYRGIAHFQHWDGENSSSISRVVIVRKENGRYVCELESEALEGDKKVLPVKLPYKLAKYSGDTDKFYGEMYMNIRNYNHFSEAYYKYGMTQYIEQMCYLSGEVSYKGDTESLSGLLYIDYRYSSNIDKNNPTLELPPEDILTREAKAAVEYSYGGSDGGGGRQLISSFIDDNMTIAFGEGSSYIKQYIVDNMPLESYEVEVDIGAKIIRRVTLKRISVLE